MTLVARRESFGGIIGHSDAYGFSVVNHEGFRLLNRLSESNYSMGGEEESPSIGAFFAELKKRSWWDGRGQLSCRFLDNRNCVSHLSAPIRVWLEVTSRCNLSCAQCINENHPAYLTPDLSFADIQQIIDQLYEAAVIQITITGGEPLIRKDIFPILDLIVGRKFGLRFFTNGTSLTEANADRLSEYPISHLFLSLDGTGEFNNILRGVGTCGRIARGLAILSRKPVNLTLSTTLHRFSFADIDALFSLANEHGVRSILIRPVFQYREHNSPISIPAEQLQDLLESLEIASAKFNVEYQLNKLPFRPLGKTVFFYDHPSDVHFSYFSQHNSFGCVGGNTVVGIKANGVIMACGFLPHEYAVRGNSVLERPFLDLWNRSENVTVLRNLVGNSVCRGCSLLKLCGGGCRANALLRSGDLNAVDPYCYWLDKAPPELTARPEARQYADGPEPYISDRTIVTKCGAGSHL